MVHVLTGSLTVDKRNLVFQYPLGPRMEQYSVVNIATVDIFLIIRRQHPIPQTAE